MVSSSHAELISKPRRMPHKGGVVGYSFMGLKEGREKKDGER